MVIGLTTLMLMGCEVDFENRRLPDPVFHGEDIFGETRAIVSSTQQVEDPFAELSATDAQPEVTTQDLKNVTFARGVKSRLPNDAMGGGWSTSSSDTEFLIVHEETTSNGPVPSAIIYGYYDPQSNTNPTLTTRRFISVVDPSFEQTGLWELSGFISNVVSALSVDNPISTTELQSVLSVFQPTFGIGLGYHSFPESFTGWKWVGQNQYGIVYSLGKTKGKFVNSSGDLRSKILSLQDMTSEDLLQDLSTLTSLQEEVATMSGVPAEMILGTMSYQGQTVYISMMCLTQPTCNQKNVLIDVLNNMSPIRSQDIISSSLFSSPSQLGRKYGLSLFQSPAEIFGNVDDIVNDELTKLKNADVSSVFSNLPDVSSISEVTGDTIEDLVPSVQQEGVENSAGGSTNTQGQDDSGY